MKKLILLTLILCLALFSFSGCNKDSQETIATTAPSSPTPTVKLTSPPVTTNAATQSPSSTPVESSAVKEYSIDLDFQISTKAFSVVFGYYDEIDFLVWQINIADWEGEQKVTFKPHRWVDGTPVVLDQFDINNAIKWDDRNKTHHLKITVSPTNNITTYINDVKVHEYTDELAEYNNLFGFRQCQDEAAYVDNIVITNTANNKIITQYDFESGNPFDDGEIQSGIMETPALYIAALTSHGTDFCILEE